MVKKEQNFKTVSGSFRDPSGFLFWQNGELYRQINQVYKKDYEFLMKSGLYEELLKKGWLIEHKEVKVIGPKPERAYKTIKPKKVPFVSYPYEWCFSQLKDAALLTLKIQRKSLKYGMTLVDSSAYNIQFLGSKPVFIDTLSFKRYIQDQPWTAYRQFCQHFLAPLALMSYKDIRLSQLLRIYIDGIPLDLASILLPFRSRFSLSLLSHLHLHAKSQEYFAQKTVSVSHLKLNLKAQIALLENLESFISQLKLQKTKTEWAEYYQETNYSHTAFENKKKIVSNFLNKIKPKSVWDLGANTGIFSRLASQNGIFTVAFDNDLLAVEKNYLESKRDKETNLLPLVLDLTNPSPALGWANSERMSFKERGPVDAVLALALVHHLAISNNLPFAKIAEFLRGLCKWLIIEFVPKSDSQVQRLLQTREDIFSDYNQAVFEKEFSRYFSIVSSVKIKESQRRIYLMR